jgi:hypothetical protein
MAKVLDWQSQGLWFKSHSSIVFQMYFDSRILNHLISPFIYVECNKPEYYADLVFVSFSWFNNNTEINTVLYLH